MKLLALDTATEWCSVALLLNGAVHTREVHAARGHGDHVLALVDSLLSEAGVALRSLDAIAFGRGPGAFTGVRLAASVTQGLAFAAGLPVIPVSDLRALAQQALSRRYAIDQGASLEHELPVLVCHDARMGEVYWAGFVIADGFAQAATAEAVTKPENLFGAAQAWLGRAAGAALGVGSGFAQYPSLVSLVTIVMPELLPRAAEIAALAERDGLASAIAPELAVPVYVRNNVATISGANTAVGCDPR